MKLLFALLVVSALTLKVKGGDVAYNMTCTPGSDNCTTSNAECKADDSGTNRCLCEDNYEYDDTACSGAATILASVTVMLLAVASRFQ